MVKNINDIERPLDLINNLKGKNVIVILRDRKILGTLLAFDIHINLVLDNAKIIDDSLKTPEYKEKNIGLIFLRGDNIISISGGN